MMSGNSNLNFFAIKYQEKLSQFTRQPTYNLRQTNKFGSLSISPYEPYPSSSSRYEKSISQSPQTSNSKLTARRKKTEVLPAFSINKNSPRVDINLFEEIANGGKWEGVKGRVIYRNHTPKKSYYLLCSLKELSEQQQQELPILSRNYSKEQMEFNSKFESGNAEAIVRVSRDEYHVFTREDTNTHGLRQWFYFQAKSNRNMRVNFRIYSFSKHYSLYRRGMKPYVRINREWQQAGEDVTYSRDSQLNCYYLGFSLHFSEGQRLQIANMPPYTYSHLLRFLNHLQENNPVQVQTLGCSLGGVDIPIVRIVQSTKGGQRRRAVLILARTHPGQTCSNFSLQNIAKGLCQSEYLRSKYNFFIVPMVNPDGVIVGNHRTSLIGMDLNRCFTAVSSYTDLFPQVEAVKRLVKQLQHSHLLEFIIDLHGHSAQRDVFAYAGYQPADNPARIIPKLINRAWQGFNYDTCVFGQSREKNTTARVHFRNRCNITSITFEQSYGILGKNLINVEDWRSFGNAFVIALTEYTRLYLQNPQALTKQLEEEIEDQLKKEAPKVKNQNCRLQQEGEPIQPLNYEQNQQKEPPSKVEEKIQLKKEENCAAHDEIDSLQSGDQEMQICEEQLNFILKNMQIKLHQYQPRKLYQLNDRTIEYSQAISEKEGAQPSTIHHKLPLVSRILRTKTRKVSVDLIDLLTSKGKKPQKGKMKMDTSIRLPALSNNQNYY